jgi:antitoxin (DNA-binding transcriptional repressor) of toxin-antitoxin stability system
MNIAEAEEHFAQLVEKVHLEGISIDLERDDKIIARLTPAKPKSPLTIGGLHDFLSSLPPLADDAADFARDVRAIRSAFPMEADLWD